jgi:[methyl-Co(III) methanol-specific corrinoid protein]:coenzyme M methyltransferase
MTTDTMTPKERFLAAIAGRSVDRTPVASPTSVATVEQMRRTGAPFPGVHVDGPGMARLAAGAHEILGYDAIMPVFSVVQEAAALGCEIDWGASDTMPAACTHPWSDPDQVAIPADFLERPSVKAVLDALRLLRRGGRESCFDHIHPEGRELPAQGDAVLQREDDERQLVPVSEGGVENLDPSDHAI